MALHGQHIIIIGGGIGGLASALAFRQRGADVTVLEQAEAITEVGAGLQISPNGFAVLRALGLDCELLQNSVRGRAVVLRDFRKPGEVLRLDLERFAPDQHFQFVHRADLIDILVNAARDAGVRLRLLQKVLSVDAGPQPVVHMASGAAKRADLVVGADGLHSQVRVALNGVNSPAFTGQVAWRAIVPNDLGMPAEAQVFMGPKRHMVCYPLREGSAVNIVAVQERKDWATESWSERDDPTNLRRAFSDFEGPARALLERVDQVALWGLFRHPVAQNWHKGRVAMLGDAAHPTLPFLAQGANMALEDAWVLADCVDGAETTGAGLARYQNSRRPRVVRAIKAANGNAWKYHLSFPPVRSAAHKVLNLGGQLAPERMLRQFDWLYQHDVTTH